MSIVSESSANRKIAARRNERSRYVTCTSGHAAGNENLYFRGSLMCGIVIFHHPRDEQSALER